MKNQQKIDGTLADWGEFRIISDIILPTIDQSLLLKSLGDDCAYLTIPNSGSALAITSDSTPTPLVWNLGFESYWMLGWYSVLINASDLAAAGARPVGFTTSVEAPASMRIDDFRDFFVGISDACKEMGIPNAGGNLRSAPRFECHGTAIGIVKSKKKLLARDGCRPGDVLVSVGDCGRFISSYLRARKYGIGTLKNAERKKLIQPFPQLRAMICLHEEGFVSAASDNSDGLLGALWNIGERSNCGFEVYMDDRILHKEVKRVSVEFKIDPWNLMFFWGDWQVVATIEGRKINRFKTYCRENGVKYSILGQAIDGPPILCGVRNGKRVILPLLRNENLTASSFHTDIDAQLDYMLKTPLLI